MANVLTTGAVKQREVSDPITTAAAQFWSLTLYDTETRAMIQNRANDSARSGLDTLETNPDGSVDLYFGPAGSAPAGLEANWIETSLATGFTQCSASTTPRRACSTGHGSCRTPSW